MLSFFVCPFVYLLEPLTIACGPLKINELGLVIFVYRLYIRSVHTDLLRLGQSHCE